MNTAVVAFALLAAASLVAPALADTAATLTGKRLEVVRADGAKVGTIELDSGGVARRTAPSGQQSAGTWAMKGDRLCVLIPPRKTQACFGSAADLAAHGHATMTNLAGQKMTVTIQ
jgi:hypothetical protein